MKIRVTQEHIDKGVPRNPWYCPVALAIREQVSDITEVTVKKDTLLVWANYLIAGKVYSFSDTYKLSMRMGKWIRMFDAGDTVNPISFIANESV